MPSPEKKYLHTIPLSLSSPPSREEDETIALCLWSHYLFLTIAELNHGKVGYRERERVKREREEEEEHNAFSVPSHVSFH
ncbi:hypothetical protein EUTSA_v10000408mg [Eutrema salsugineum]|uniref:Uncharacterized protein n=1 Tax=Eutrema salsugineum TaxID=72664 RepID=V4LU92_EUTSA|nr:hypothetical protein EUTSA_v10000408mg [Eutrema salsugineum]